MDKPVSAFIFLHLCTTLLNWYVNCFHMCGKYFKASTNMSHVLKSLRIRDE